MSCSTSPNRCHSSLALKRPNLSLCTRNRACVTLRGPHLTRNGVLCCSSSTPSFIEAALSSVPLEALAASHPGLAVGIGAATVVFVFGLPVLLSGLTPAGVLTSWLLGSLVFAAFGRGGFALVCVYFLLGSAVTKFKLKEKTEKGIAEARGGKRGPVRFLSHKRVQNCNCKPLDAFWASSSEFPVS